MTEKRRPLADKLAKAGDDDFLRGAGGGYGAAADGFGRTVAQRRVSRPKDVKGLIGAGRHERTAERQTYRYRHRATSDAIVR